MVNRDLLNYIRDGQRKGWPLNVIKGNLVLGGGWSESDVMEAFRSLRINTEGLEVRPGVPMPSPVSSVQAGPSATFVDEKIVSNGDNSHLIFFVMSVFALVGVGSGLVFIINNTEITPEIISVAVVEEPTATAEPSLAEEVLPAPTPTPAPITAPAPKPAPKPAPAPTPTPKPATSAPSTSTNSNLTSANTSIKGNLSNIRAQANSYYSANGSYGQYTDSGACNVQNTMFTDPTIAQGLAAIQDASSQVGVYSRPVCRTNGSQWVIATELFIPENHQDIWCTDSAGRSQAQYTYGNSFACE